jgi:hypothetical protein
VTWREPIIVLEGDARRTGPGRAFYLLLLTLGLLGGGCGEETKAPPSLPPEGMMATKHGLFRVSLHSLLIPIPLDRIHIWTLALTDGGGRPVEDAQIEVTGGMPLHGHGLPTRPRVSPEAGAGRYKVNGLKFNMPGVWIVNFQISAGGARDEITIPLTLQ